MKEKINRMFEAMPSISKRFFWITLALAIKSIFFIYKTEIEERPTPNIYFTHTFANEWGDTYSYIEPIESYIAYGNYGGPVYSDYRMPGYVFPYYFIRFAFDVDTSLNILVLLQLLLGAISVYLLAKIAMNLLKNEKVFYIVFFLYAINTFVSLFDSAVMSESFCSSALIISVYYLLREGNRNRNLFISGLFLTWCIFLKPVMILLLVFYSLYIFIDKTENKVKLNWIAVLCFTGIFVVVESAWMIRNERVHNKFIPLTTSKYYPGTDESYLGPLFEFMNAYGGSVVWWDPSADVTFFKPVTFKVDKKPDIKLPENIYTNEFNYDSLLAVRNLIGIVNDTTIDKATRRQSELVAMDRLKRYAESIKANHPFMYYIGSRFKVLKNYFVHSGTSILFTKSSANLNLFMLGLKVFYSALYMLIVAGGFLSSFYLLLKREVKSNYGIISITGLYIALVFPFLFKMDEYRYFVPGYPFFMLAIILAVFTFKNKPLKDLA